MMCSVGVSNHSFVGDVVQENLESRGLAHGKQSWQRIASCNSIDSRNHKRTRSD